MWAWAWECSNSSCNVIPWNKAKAEVRTNLSLHLAGRSPAVETFIPLATFILPRLAEFANLSRGVFVARSGWHERSVDAGGASRGSSARAVPQGGARGKPLVPARTFNSASNSPFSLQCPLALSAGGPDCPSEWVGKPSPSSRFAFADHYPELLAKLLASPDSEVGLVVGRGRDDF